jgi:hypothetical protein
MTRERGHSRRLFVLLVLCFALGASAVAQSPNTAGLVVIVVDQTGAVIPGAQVVVINTATGGTRDAASGPDGSATIAGLSITGSYEVNVTKPGFTTGNVTRIALRAGETASVRVKLTASGWMPRSSTSSRSSAAKSLRFRC